MGCSQFSFLFSLCSVVSFFFLAIILIALSYYDFAVPLTAVGADDGDENHDTRLVAID